MADSTDPARPPARPRPPSPARAPGAARPAGSPGAALIAFLAVVAGSVLLGLAGGVLWSLLAPRVLYVAVGHATAQVVNPETSAFIAADGWFSVMGVAGGIITGLLGYLLAVRRYGPLAMAGVLGGGLAAAYAAMKLGQQIGHAHFYALLAASRRGALLRAPVSLGSHEALAFWPLAAGLVAGGLEAVAALRQRSRVRGAHAAAPAGPVGLAALSQPQAGRPAGPLGGASTGPGEPRRSDRQPADPWRRDPRPGEPPPGGPRRAGPPWPEAQAPGGPPGRR